jgi:hypothetical protein
VGVTEGQTGKTPPPKPAWKAGSLLFRSDDGFRFRYGYLLKTDILHHSPNDGQTTHLGGKGINLIGALSNIALRSLLWHWSSECDNA